MKTSRAGGTPVIVDYYFSVLSDWAYMGGERFENLMRRLGTRVNYKPMKLAELYSITGGIVLQKRSKQRQDYRVVELVRYRDKLGMPITLHPRYYPTNDTLAACSIIAATKVKGADVGRLINMIHRAIWAEEQDVADVKTLERIIAGCHLDPRKLLEAARSKSTLAVLDRNTKEAASRGVFGSPFYIVGDDIFWGQDRLDFLEESIERAKAAKR